MLKINKPSAKIIVLVLLIAIFIIGYGGAKLITLRSLTKEFDARTQTIESLTSIQEDKTELLDQINLYRDGLYALNLVLEARKNIISGSDDENPYLVFDFTQVLNDLRRLLPRDARVTKFQINNKGLVTIPIESVDYASLGRVLKSFKDSDLFLDVKIPSGAQRTPRQSVNAWGGRYFENVYSFVIQADLDPAFWQNPMPYPDVYSKAYYAQAIRDLTIAGTIEGYPDGLFRPDKNINRAEFFKLALFEFLSNDTISIDEYKKYIDLSDKDWHYQYIQLASKMGIAEGDKVGKFHPNQAISRIEALKTILTIFDVEIPHSTIEEQSISEKLDEKSDDVVEEEKTPIILPFTDVSPDDDIYPIVRAAIDNGLMDNMSNKLNPNQNVSRSEVTYWVWKLKFDYLSDAETVNIPE